jgi:hypothetical protein
MARQRMALKRGTNPKVSRRACTCVSSGYTTVEGGVAKRPRELISHPKSLMLRFATFRRCIGAALPRRVWTVVSNPSSRSLQEEELCWIKTAGTTRTPQSPGCQPIRMNITSARDAGRGSDSPRCRLARPAWPLRNGRAESALQPPCAARRRSSRTSPARAHNWLGLGLGFVPCVTYLRHVSRGNPPSSWHTHRASRVACPRRCASCAHVTPHAPHSVASPGCISTPL